MSARLTAKQEAFALALFQGISSRQAYRTIYAAARMSDASVDVAASRLLNNAKVALRLAELRAVVEAKAVVTVERIERELGRVAFGDVRNVFTWDATGVHYRDSSDLTEDEAAMVGGVKMKRRRVFVPDASGPPTEWEVEEFEIKIHDKLAALNALARIKGMFPKDGAVVNVTVDQRRIDLALVDDVLGEFFPEGE